MSTKYLNNRLHGNEQISYRGTVSWIAVLARGVIAVVAGGVLLGISKSGSALAVVGLLILAWGLFALVSGVLFKTFSEYAVTDRRVIGKYGVFRPQSVDVLLTSISGVSTSFTFLGRIFGYGSLLVNGGGTQRLLVYLADPKAFENAIHERLEQSRLLKGTAAYTLDVQFAQPPSPAPAAAGAAPTSYSGPPSIAFCGNCGTALVDSAPFCRDCGSAV